MSLSNETTAVTVLVVDDEDPVREVLRGYLEAEGYLVWEASSATSARAQLERRGFPHIALVDIRMPGETGIELARNLKQYSDLPIIMITAVDDTGTIAEALNEFAEDYVIKPVERKVLAARVGSVLRRIGDTSYTLGPSVKVDDNLVVEVARQRVIIRGSAVQLTPTETKMLHILIRNLDRPVRTQFLLRRLWPLQEVYEDVLRVHVSRLRRKIEVDPQHPAYLRTVRGVGYRFNAHSGSQPACSSA